MKLQVRLCIEKSAYFCSCIALLFVFLPTIAQSAPTVTASSLQRLLDENRYIEFQSQLGQARNLNSEQTEYFHGMLASRLGRFDEAQTLLFKAMTSTTASLNAQQNGEALKTLGENAMKQSQYGVSAQMYDMIDKTWGAQMPDGGKSTQEKRQVARLLQQVPVQTIQINDDFSFARTGLEYPVSVGGEAFSAQFDTGAEISVLSATTAKRWGVTLLDGEATFQGFGGGAFTAQPGFIPSLTIGKAELHNVAVYVTADQNLYIAQIKRQTNALLGFPVITALGRLTFSKDGGLAVSKQSPAVDPRTDVQLWFAGHALLVPLGTVPVIDHNQLVGNKEPRLFVLDTGSGSSYLTDHYFAEHTNVFRGKPREVARLAGAGGIKEIPAFGARDLPLFVGDEPIFLNGPHVLTKPTDGEAENYFGVIGQDLLTNFSSYTLDFRNRTFSVQP